jgi:hypothetical protein
VKNRGSRPSATAPPNEQPTIKEIFLREGYHFLSFLIPFLFDTAIGLVVFGVFLLFSWLITFAREGGGAKQSFLDAYEFVHGWLNIGLFSMLGFRFLLRIVRGNFRRK